jgi:hypothetical protein
MAGSGSRGFVRTLARCSEADSDSSCQLPLQRCFGPVICASRKLGGVGESFLRGDIRDRRRNGAALGLVSPLGADDV